MNYTFDKDCEAQRFERSLHIVGSSNLERIVRQIDKLENLMKEKIVQLLREFPDCLVGN